MVDNKIVDEIKMLNGFYKRIRENKDECVIDLMIEYCDELNIPVEALGYLINEDKYLKDYISNNLIKFKYTKNLKDSELLDIF